MTLLAEQTCLLPLNFYLLTPAELFAKISKRQFERLQSFRSIALLLYCDLTYVCLASIGVERRQEQVGLLYAEFLLALRLILLQLLLTTRLSFYLVSGGCISVI